MPCDTRIKEQERQRIIEELESRLRDGSASINKDTFGRVTIEGFDSESLGMTDLCVLAAAMQSDSFEVRMAAQSAGLEDRDFVKEHGHSHSH